MRVMRVALVALVAAAFTVGGCTSQSTREEPAESELAPTHAIFFTTEDDATDNENVGGVAQVIAVDLETSEQLVLAETTSTSVAQLKPPALSPDGTSLLYSVDEQERAEWPEYYSDLPRLGLYALDLASGESARVCPQSVRSYGWDGDDVIATTWEGYHKIGQDGLGVSYEGPVPNSVLRISGSEVATVATGDLISTDASPSVEHGTDQLDFLGAYRGDLFFTSNFPGSYRLSLLRDTGNLEVWALRSMGASLTLAYDARAEQTDAPQALFDDELDRLQYPTWIADGMLPTIEVEMLRPGSPQGVPASAPSPVPPRSVFVRDPVDMGARRSFETTITRPFGDRRVFPRFDDALDRWLDQRWFEAPEVPEAGVWLCETIAETQETTRLVSLGDGETQYSALGYLGSAGDVLYASGDGDWHNDGVAAREVYAWSRDSAEVRTLLTVTPTSPNARRLLVHFVGSVAIP